MNPPNSDTPRTNAATCDSRNGIRSSEGTVVLASFARQLEKELNEAKHANTRANELLGSQATENDKLIQQLTSRLEASERANSEMRELLKQLRYHDLTGSHRADDCFVCEHVEKALCSTSGQSYIPREVGEKMYEALKMVDMQHPFMFVTLAKALQLAQSYGLGKKA